MKTSNSKLVSIGAAGLAALGAFAFASGGGEGAQDLTPIQWTQTAKATPKRSAARVPARIVENRGQLDARVAAAVTGSRRQVFFTKDSVKIRLLGERGDAGRSAHVVELGFAGANPSPEIALESELPGAVHYFRGGAAAWKTGVKGYREVVYRELWPGIDARFSLEGTALKYRFDVAPGADASAIRLAVRGANGARVQKDGGLALDAGAFELLDAAPVAWQGEGASRQGVDARFAVTSSGGEPVVGFEVGAHDASRPLVIDPTVIVESGFLGGSGEDWATSIAMDGAKNLYICGTTDSDESKFPEKGGPDLTFNSVVGYDAFVAKLDPSGTQLVYLGYIGGLDSDAANEVAVDNAGCAYVTGYTRSSPGEGFPIAVGPRLTWGYGRDGFIAKVSADGSLLQYCGYIGGTGDYDVSNAVAVDGAGCAYVGGITNSTSSSFPVVAGPDLTSNGNYDGFVAKVKADGTGFVYCGYVGGGASDIVTGVAVDGANRLTICGTTASNQASFPVTAGPDLTHNGGYDAFLSKLDASGTSYVHSGYIGGSDDDEAKSLDLDNQGNAIVVGSTLSMNFPVLTGPGLVHGGGEDGFVTKVNAAGTALAWSGYFGGSNDDLTFDVDIDAAGDAYIAGWTTSTHATAVKFPLLGGPDLTHGGKTDGFIAKLSGANAALVYSGFLGGSGDDIAYAVQYDGAGAAWVVGYATSSGYPRFGAMDVTYNGGFSDATLTKVKTFEMEPPSPLATADVVKWTGKITDSPLANKDSIRVTGTYAPNGKSDGVFAPATEGLVFAVGDLTHPFVVAIPGGDPAWIVKNGRAKWSSPKGAVPKISVTFDTTKRTYLLTVAQLNLTGPIENPLGIEWAVGNEYARRTGVWDQKKAGSFTVK